MPREKIVPFLLYSTWHIILSFVFQHFFPANTICDIPAVKRQGSLFCECKYIRQPTKEDRAIYRKDMHIKGLNRPVFACLPLNPGRVSGVGVERGGPVPFAPVSTFTPKIPPGARGIRSQRDYRHR